MITTSKYKLSTEKYTGSDYDYTKNFVEHYYEVPVESAYNPVLKDTYKLEN